MQFIAAALSRGCAIALCWELFPQLLLEMDSSFRTFFRYCNAQIALGNLSCSVFTPVMHYLSHLMETIQTLGPLNAYSCCRSNERFILKFKTLMAFNHSSQAQPSNLIAEEAMLSLFGHLVNIEVESNIQRPAPYSASTWREHSNGQELPRQLWEPFKSISLSEDNHDVIEGCSYLVIHRALSAYYARRFSEASLVVRGNTNFKFAGRAQLDYKFVITSTYYARINRESRRAGYYVFFRSPFLDFLGQSKKGWYVGKVLFYMKHTYRQQTFFLACVDVFKSVGTKPYSSTIPVVQKSLNSTMTKLAIISLDFDIDFQVGLVEYDHNHGKFSVIIPSNVLTTNMLQYTGLC